MPIEEPDCVQWQHRGGERIYEATKDLTREELVAWWRERDREFREWMEELRARQATPDERTTVPR